MKYPMSNVTLTLWASALLVLSADAQNLLVNGSFESGTHLQMNAQNKQTGRYAAVNGLKMYHEIHGSGRPLVLLHGAGSTIESTFGRILPELAGSEKISSHDSSTNALINRFKEWR